MTNKIDNNSAKQISSPKRFYKKLAIYTTIVYLVIVVLTLFGIIHPFGASCTNPLDNLVGMSTDSNSYVAHAARPSGCTDDASRSDCFDNSDDFHYVLAAEEFGPFVCEGGSTSLLVFCILPICVFLAFLVTRIYHWKLKHITNDCVVYVGISILYVALTTGIIIGILYLLHSINTLLNSTHTHLVPELIALLLLFCITPAIALFVADRLIWLATRKIKR